MFRLLPCPSYCKQCWNIHWGIVSLSILVFSVCIPSSGIAGSFGSSIPSKTGYYLKNTRYVKMSENNKELFFFFSSKNMAFVKEVSFFWGVSLFCSRRKRRTKSLETQWKNKELNLCNSFTPVYCAFLGHLS